MTSKAFGYVALATVAVFLIVSDVFLAVDSTPGNTYSEILLTLSRHPVLPFSFGVLMGHFFWPQRIRR